MSMQTYRGCGYSVVCINVFTSALVSCLSEAGRCCHARACVRVAVGDVLCCSVQYLWPQAAVVPGFMQKRQLDCFRPWTGL